MSEDERLLGIHEIARRLDLSTFATRDWLRQGRLPGGFHVGRHWKIREADLSAFIRKLAEESAPADAERAAARRAKAKAKAAE
jgi:excisionase family DNA binding protein